MKERKLKEDYILKTQISSSGREKQVPVYRGEWFTTGSQISPAKAAAIRAPWFLLALLPLVIYLFLNVPSTRCMYVLLPAICGLLPCFYWGMGLFSFRKTKLPMTRLQKEKGPGRMVRSSFGSMIITAATILGELVFIFFFGGDRQEEALPLILFTLALSGSVTGFIKNRQLFQEIIKSPDFQNTDRSGGGSS